MRACAGAGFDEQYRAVSDACRRKPVNLIQRGSLGGSDPSRLALGHPNALPGWRLGSSGDALRAFACLETVIRRTRKGAPRRRRRLRRFMVDPDTSVSSGASVVAPPDITGPRYVPPSDEGNGKSLLGRLLSL